MKSLTNGQIYKKLMPLYLVGFLIDLVAIAILIGGATAGFFVGGEGDNALIGLVIGLLVGAVLVVIYHIFVGNLFHSAVVAMMQKAIVRGEIETPVIANGLRMAKSRFSSITGFFFISSAIRGAFRQIGRVITGVGRRFGGDAGQAVGSILDSAVQTLIGYLSDCCLAWVFYRENLSMGKAALEGAAIFFKHGKTFAQNAGRIFGMGLLSLLVIGGALFGISYAIVYFNPNLIQLLATEIGNAMASTEGGAPDFLTNPTTLGLITSAIGALIIWSPLHALFVKPFILIGVMKNFMKTGMENLPTAQEIGDVTSRAPKLARLENK